MPQPVTALPALDDDQPCRCARQPCGDSGLPAHAGHCCTDDPDRTQPCHEEAFIRAHLASCSVPHTRLRRFLA